MWEFITKTGVAGILAVALVALAVFLLAQPGTEISVFAIKFRKRLRNPKQRKFKKVPAKLPKLWTWILDVFGAHDVQEVSVEAVLTTFKGTEFSNVEVMRGIDEMQAVGLVNLTGGGTYLELLERGRDIVILNLKEYSVNSPK